MRNGFNSSLRNYGPKLWPYFSLKSNGNNNYLRFGKERYLTLKSRSFSVNCYGRILIRKTAERNCFDRQKHVTLPIIAAANLGNFGIDNQKRKLHSNESWLKYKLDERIFGHGTDQI